MNAGFFGLDPTRTGYAKNRSSKESGTDFSAAVMRTLSPKTLSQFKVMAEILLAGKDFFIIIVIRVQWSVKYNRVTLILYDK